MAAYTPLFQVDFNHPYYHDGKGRDLYLKPDGNTSLLMRNGRWIWRRLESGYVMLYEYITSGSDPVIGISGDQTLVFSLDHSSPQVFQSFTDLDVITETAVNPSVNQAENKDVTVSSVKDGSSGGENAVDGSNATSWQSEENDDQFIIVDLGQLFRITEIDIKWQKRAETFEIQVAHQPGQWIAISRFEGSNGNNINVSGLAATGRYVRIQCEESNNGKGYGIKELSVFANASYEVTEYTSGKVAYFKNVPASASSDPNNAEIIAQDLIDRIVPAAFNFVYALETPVDTIVEVTGPTGEVFKLTGPDDNTATIIPDDDGVSGHPVRLGSRPSGLYIFTVKTTDESQTLATKRLYYHPELAGTAPLGIVEIAYPGADAHLFGDQEYYALQFDQKATYWTFTIIDKSGQIDFTDADLVIEDDSGDTGNPYATYEFVKGPLDESSTEWAGRNAITFNSKQPIPLFQSPKTGLALKNTSASDPVIISHLNNPAVPGNHIVESKMYVFV
ncbi:MAG: discoidin domain-containing protein [Flavobacteriales bacterium]|nr:discoidin domain-containing protein [Flavobacteriales bacterium]